MIFLANARMNGENRPARSKSKILTNPTSEELPQ